MRYRISALVVAAAALAAAAAAAPTTSAPSRGVQDEGTLTRGAFFDTRPEAPSPRPKKPKPKPVRKSGEPPSGGMPRPLPAPPPPPPSPGTSPNKENPGKPPAQPGGKDAPAAPARIGLGHTLFLCEANKNAAVRVDAAREFRPGESIRIGLETNTDGYLYIFNDDGAKAQMLYPHGRLDGGENVVYAHTLRQIPEAGGGCFGFDERQGVERVYVVVAREPLPGVPDAETLAKQCKSRAADAPCEWDVTPDVWARVQNDAKEPTLSSRSDELLGRPLSGGEQGALTRGLTLSKAEPAPAVIRLNVSPSAGVHVTTINLVHK